MWGKSLLNEKAIIILSLNQSECLKLLRSASSRIAFSRDTGIEESACKNDNLSKSDINCHADINKEKKGRDLNQSYDKSAYTNTNVKWGK